MTNDILKAKAKRYKVPLTYEGRELLEIRTEKDGNTFRITPLYSVDVKVTVTCKITKDD